jgi:3-hydroxyisobutyrate dehydrogenase-like beta-hydroxyacid dehydrogenase
LVHLCLGGDRDVEEVVEALLAEPGAIQLIVDHSTISPGAARSLHARCESMGAAFLDAPVTGGTAGAQAGTLTCFCGGTRSAFDHARLSMEAFCRRVELIGGPGAGQTLKCVNQIAVGGALLGLCESFAFAEVAGLDLNLVRDLIGGGAAGSWAIEHYGPKVVSGDHTPGFSIRNQRKDFAICRQSAAGLGLDLPACALADELLESLEEQGRGEEATTALIDVYRGARRT